MVDYSENDPNHQKNIINHTDDEESDAGSSGGQRGQIGFVDFLGANERLRDDLLSADEKKRLLFVHQNVNEASIKKQKDTLAERKALKEGKITLASHRAAQAAKLGGSNRLSHPALANKAQFSGIDEKVSSLPEKYEADSNQENRDQLENQYRLTNMPRNQPTFNPKPQR